MKIIKKKAKNIFTRTGIPGAKWVINQYVGCQHSCLYCYAKYMSKWRPPEYGKWGSWVEVKTNAPELAREKYIDGWLYMSSVSDPYQPIERELKLTRKVLENLDKRIKLSILTKSDLVIRDIDLFKKFKEIEIGLTINSFRGELKEIFEPFSPSNEERIKALEILRKNGIATYTFISPVIPGLLDLEKIIKETKDFTDFYWFEFINLKLAGREFIEKLRERFPQSWKILESRQRFRDFIKEIESKINLSHIRVRGVEKHQYHLI